MPMSERERVLRSVLVHCINPDLVYKKLIEYDITNIVQSKPNYLGIALRAPIDNVEVIQYLVKRYFTDQKMTLRDRDCLLVAVDSGILEKVRYLLEECDISLRKPDSPGDLDEEFAKDCMVRTIDSSASLEIVKYLHERHKVPVWIKGEESAPENEEIMSPLISSIFKPSYSIFLYLMEECDMCNIVKTDKKFRYSCLDAAVDGSSNEAESMLILRYFFDQCDIDSKEFPFLMSHTTSFTAFRYLIEECGVDPRTVHDGQNALTFASQGDDMDYHFSKILYLVYQHDMLPWKRVNGHGVSALEEASSHQMLEVLNFFIFGGLTTVDERRRCAQIATNAQIGEILLTTDSAIRAKSNCSLDEVVQSHLFLARGLSEERCHSILSTSTSPNHFQVHLSSSADSLYRFMPKIADIRIYFTPYEFVYAKREYLKQSCAYMERLLSDEFDDICKDFDGMDKLSLQEDCPRQYMHALIVSLGHPLKNEESRYFTAPQYVLKHSDLVDALKFLSLCSKWGLNPVHSWHRTLKNIVKQHNEKWKDLVDKGLGTQESLIPVTPPLTTQDQELWLEHFTNDVDIHFFMLLHGSPEHASVCMSSHEFLVSEANTTRRYVDWLEQQRVVEHIFFTTHFNLKEKEIYLRASAVDGRPEDGDGQEKSATSTKDASQKSKT